MDHDPTTPEFWPPSPKRSFRCVKVDIWDENLVIISWFYDKIAFQMPRKPRVSCKQVTEENWGIHK